MDSKKYFLLPMRLKLYNILKIRLKSDAFFDLSKKRINSRESMSRKKKLNLIVD